ncbi:MAG: putative sulfate exporter family transporter [bacterium]
MEGKTKNTLFSNEDWLAVWLGLFIFCLGLLKVCCGTDVLGWVVKNSVWMDLGKSFAAVSKTYTEMPPIISLVLTYLFLLVIMTIGAMGLGVSLKKFILSFTIVFGISFVCWTLGHYAYIAATPDQLQKFGIGWSCNLTGEAGLIIALLVGLCIGNFFPQVTNALKEGIKPEWYIKTAIVILGAGLGVKAVEALGLATSVIFRGFCAIVEAYLIYWAVVYFIARKYFKFSREWVAPLASGISICGVSAAIATGAAIKAKPRVAIMVSSLVVVFAVIELILLPFLSQIFLYKEPMVAGAWMGLAVKTDGAAVASGAITDSFIRAKVLALQGINYKEGWILMTSTTTKIFIDIFIGIWAFILALVWVYAIEKKPGEKVKPIEMWHRFPKFVIGYCVTFLVMLALCLISSGLIPGLKETTEQCDVFRKLFFAMTFFSIGAVSNFRQLWQEGIGKLTAVYVLCLFGFIIWVGLFISWIFFHGIKPPVI